MRKRPALPEQPQGLTGGIEGRVAGVEQRDAHPRRLVRPLGGFAALSLIAACSGSADEQPERSETTEASAELATTPLPPFSSDAVVGVMERVQSGVVVGSQSIDKGAPANLGELLATGQPDAEGYVYRDVAGGYSEDDTTYVRYQYVSRKPLAYASAEDTPSKPAGAPAPAPAPRPKLSPELVTMLATEDPSEVVEIYVRLGQKFKTSLRSNAPLGFTSLADAEAELEARQAIIATRRAEADALQASVVTRLQELGARDIGGFWTSNGVAAHVPLGSVAELALHEDVEAISLPAQGHDDSATEWDGDDMKASGGLNAGVYHDNGFHGQAYANNTGGRYMRIAVIGGGFDHDHPGFTDCVGCGSRVIKYMDCRGNPCVEGTAPALAHATKVAGLATGSIRQDQIAGFTNQEELERTGIAEEPLVYPLAIDADTNDAKRAIEWAVATGVDVLVSSTGFGSTACDGVVGSDLEETIYEAQLQQLIVVQSAGNSYDGSGTCTIAGIAEAPSAFAAGSAGQAPSSCTKSNWSTCDISSFSNRGGMNATVNGWTHSGVLTLADAIAPGCPKYYFNTSGGISESIACGTSYSSPQIGGTGILIKDWFLDQGHTAITVEGRLFAVMLAMTDRASGASSFNTWGFDPRWGGGRFQARFFSGSEPGGLWAWETYSAVFTATGQQDDHAFSGTAAEPTSLSQFKAYAVVFEDDNLDIADIDLYVHDQNCGSTPLGSDASRDVKSMVRLGTDAAGKALCTRTKAFHIPSGQSRRAHVYAYYSGGTSMR